MRPSLELGFGNRTHGWSRKIEGQNQRKYYLRWSDQIFGVKFTGQKIPKWKLFGSTPS